MNGPPEIWVLQLVTGSGQTGSYLARSGVDKVVGLYRRTLEHFQKAKKDELMKSRIG